MHRQTIYGSRYRSCGAGISCEGGIVGKKDIGLKSYLQNRARYADLWNGGVFHGKQLVKPEELQEMTPVRSKSDKLTVLERTGDLVMKQNYGGQRFAVLSLENQDEIDYEMPVRIMMQEVLEYDRQIKEIRRENEKAYKEYKENQGRNGRGTRAGNYHDAGEYLYKVKKDDRLFPVATLIVYWGKEEWKGPRSLHDMIDFGDGNTMMSRELKRWIPEYPLHFLDLSTFGHFEYFRTELRPLLELFQRRGSRKKFMEYLEQNEEYWDMDDESWHMLGQLTNFKNIENFLKRKNERDKEEKKMFIDDMIDEAIEKGKTEGKAEDILDLLEEYGTVHDKLKTEILKQTDLQVLKSWLKLAAQVKNIDEFVKQTHLQTEV